MQTADLGQGWHATANDDATFTIRNPDKGQLIDLSAESGALFVRLWNESRRPLGPDENVGS